MDGRIAQVLAGFDAISLEALNEKAAMLERLVAHDTTGLVADGTLAVLEADMVHGLPDRTFTMTFVAYNTLFNLTNDGAQAECFRQVADRLRPGGRFVIEAFVPDEPARHGDDVSVRTLTADRVVLSVTRHDGERRTASGQFVELTEAGGVRLRPWSIRYATPGELDAMAAAAGFDLEHRWEAFDRTPFDAESPRHVTVYRRAGAIGATPDDR